MNKSRLILILVFLAAVLIRISFLSADPSILLDSGQVGDEGLWVYNARNLALFGKTVEDDFYSDIAAAPVFLLFAFLNFSLFGIGFWQARLISGVFGILTIFLTYKIAKKFSDKVAFLATVFASLNVLLLLHNRLAVPESLAIFFTVSSIYLWLVKKPVWAGVTLALAVLSKTTSFLYIPSVGLIILADFVARKTNLVKILRFSMATLATFLVVTLPPFMLWHREINMVYLTFGSWLAPKNLAEVWQNIFNFFLHPFWGSPFIFTLTMLAIINTLNFFCSQGPKAQERKVLILWILGTFILSPFISRITNARLLTLVVPISILAAQTLLNKNLLKIDFRDVIFRFKKFSWYAQIVILYPVAVILAKLLLAILKRALNNQEIVIYLPQFSVILLVVLIIFFTRYKSLLIKIWQFDIALIVALPAMSFIGVFFSYLSFFNIVALRSTFVISLGMLMVFLAIYIKACASNFNFAGFRNLLIGVYFVFTMMGIGTFFLDPTYKIQNASKILGTIADKNYVLGFWGHELAIENQTRPIYWAPRLANVSWVNSDFAKFAPKYLLVTTVFDSNRQEITEWPKTSDLNHPTYEITNFDVSRRFLSGERKFKIKLFQISD
ncbi:hypothetical protein A2697_01730 [Candidatus Curtissbacteria bacterium RIFCSPHIGHO2_01_FULL_41_44]|uniref:Glycosyltransferase RgtA/B/C/D-like domain-containing protein n=1 Tax=Candidatus Curtissbacteria bacterium RIFCSPLOWO2_01_FULL_42_50 TaxID=1797730 RepID=A0A1F5H6C6_9BACT|nr:MAG: hypothetical protein A2697_01730 [Candidatus Curtissbacteria bacterium RIFCSPHIGHO2_01_FULL_41_44]OGD99651.1 MAG: hypothetical protein A3B54_03105 [Candidatus Curtissbacteria bacterium RIFCSPLOWO2_01_FULL_42_50]